MNHPNGDVNCDSDAIVITCSSFSRSWCCFWQSGGARLSYICIQEAPKSLLATPLLVSSLFFSSFFLVYPFISPSFRISHNYFPNNDYQAFLKETEKIHTKLARNRHQGSHQVIKFEHWRKPKQLAGSVCDSFQSIVRSLIGRQANEKKFRQKNSSSSRH